MELDSREAEAARKKIVELEAQMEFLKEKATAAGACTHPVRQSNKGTKTDPRQWTDAPTTKTRSAA